MLSLRLTKVINDTKLVKKVFPKTTLTSQKSIMLVGKRVFLSQNQKNTVV